MKISVNKEGVCVMLEGSPPFGASGPQWRTEVSSPIEGLGRGGCGRGELEERPPFIWLLVWIEDGREAHVDLVAV